MRKILILIISLFLCSSLFGRTDESADSGVQLDVANPYTYNRVHRAGNVWLNITNWGVIGNDGPGSSSAMEDPEYPGTWAPQCEFPSGSDVQYLFMGSLWIGALVQEEGYEFPRVSTGNEGWFNQNELFPGEGVENSITPGGPITQRVVLLHVVFPQRVLEAASHSHEGIETGGGKSLGYQVHLHKFHISQAGAGFECHHLSVAGIKRAEPGVKGINPWVLEESHAIAGGGYGSFSLDNVELSATDIEADTTNHHSVFS